MADDKTERALDDCQETVQELTVENEDLREAAGTFGELAERLNQALLTERRQQADHAGDATPENGPPECPRCGKGRYVHPILASPLGHAFHCDYCGNSWH